MATDFKEQVIALAAVFQFASQVEKLAKTGTITNKDIGIAVSSLLCQNPNHTLDVYGRIGHLHPGFSMLINVLKRAPKSSNDCIRYVMGILHLQRRLQKKPSMLSTISSRLEASKRQCEYFSITHENIISGLANIYTSTVSTFNFRIQVTGEYQHLQQRNITNQIRTILFAGIRSAILWQQLGGNRIKIIFQRKQILKIAEKLLEESKEDLLK